MATLIAFIASIEWVLYALAAVGILLSIRQFVVARQLRRIAAFGLEKEHAANRTRSALTTILLLLTLVLVVYITANILDPNLVAVQDTPTPTPAVFITPEPTATEALLLFPTVTPTPGLAPADAAADAAATPVDGCTIIGSTITVPAPGDIVSGQITVEGEVNILNFGGYKFEINGPSTAGSWVVVNTFNQPRSLGVIGTWDSTSLVPGNYQLRLVTFRADGTFITPCIVPIVIAGPGGAVGP